MMFDLNSVFFKKSVIKNGIDTFIYQPETDVSRICFFKNSP